MDKLRFINSVLPPSQSRCWCPIGALPHDIPVWSAVEMSTRLWRRQRVISIIHIYTHMHAHLHIKITKSHIQTQKTSWTLTACRKTSSILKESSHSAHHLFELLPSGYWAVTTHGAKLLSTFLLFLSHRHQELSSINQPLMSQYTCYHRNEWWACVCVCVEGYYGVMCVCTYVYVREGETERECEWVLLQGIPVYLQLSSECNIIALIAHKSLTRAQLLSIFIVIIDVVIVVY